MSWRASRVGRAWVWPVIDGGVVVVETCECAVWSRVVSSSSDFPASEPLEEEEEEWRAVLPASSSSSLLPLLAFCASGELGGRGGRPRGPVWCFARLWKFRARSQKSIFAVQWVARWARAAYARWCARWRFCARGRALERASRSCWRRPTITAWR